MIRQREHPGAARAAVTRHGGRTAAAIGTIALVVAALGAWSCSEGHAASAPATPARAAANADASRGGATLVKPIALTVSGASCEDDGKGSIGATFGGGTLAFNIGPATVGAAALGMSTAPYKGPGTYTKAIINGYVPKKVGFGGLGTIVVHADRRTGTFATADGTASGTWDCGMVLR